MNPTPVTPSAIGPTVALATLAVAAGMFWWTVKADAPRPARRRRSRGRS